MAPPPFESLKNKKVRENKRKIFFRIPEHTLITCTNIRCFFLTFSPEHNFKGKNHDPSLNYNAKYIHSKYIHEDPIRISFELHVLVYW